jgi:hypothetical protein
MPSVDRPIAPGGPVRATRGHDWVGGGVPKSVDGYDTLLARGYTPGLSVTTTRSPTITVTLANRAGHSLPTADPERFLRVEARLEDTDGHVLARDVVRLGQTWDWGDAATGRPAQRTADSRLEPGETRVWHPTLPSSPNATLVVEAIHVRVTPANAAGMAHTTLDAELTALWPDAPSLLPRLDTVYPLATYIWRERVPAGGPSETASPEALVAASRALAAAPLDEKTRLLAVP